MFQIVLAFCVIALLETVHSYHLGGGWGAAGGAGAWAGAGAGAGAGGYGHAIDYFVSFNWALIYIIIITIAKVLRLELF